MSRLLAILGGEAHLPPPEVDRAEATRIQGALYELERLQPWGAVTPEALEALKARYRQRLAILRAAPAERIRLERAAAREVAAAGQPLAPPPTVAPAGPAEPPPPGISAGPEVGAPGPEIVPVRASTGLREFLAERSILIVSYIGAFLLIVATLLFELAAETFGGPARFAGVLGLDLVFGAAAWACWRSPRLRLVGATYLLIFALIAPLVFVAAYVFLLLKEQGVSVSLAVAIGALSCAALYGALAVRLRSAGYTALSGAALLTGWCAALVAAGLQDWRGAGVTPLPVLVAALAYRAPWPEGTREAGEPDQPVPSGATRRVTLAATPLLVLETLVHVAAATALVWTTLGAIDGPSFGAGAVAPRWSPAATLAGLALDYAALGWLARRWSVAPIVAAAVSLAAVAACAALDTEWWAASLALLVLAGAYTGLSVRLPAAAGIGVRRALRWLAALQAAVCSLVPARPDELQLAVVSGGTALGVLLAWSGARRPVAGEGPRARWWLLYAGAQWSLAWYWLVTVVVPPPPRPSFLGLLTAYAPLPVLLAAVAWGLGRWLGRRWAIPLYVVAAGNALWIAIGLAAERASLVPGIAYLAFAVTTYAVATTERFRGGAAVTLCLAVAGVASLLQATHAPADAWPAILAALAAAAYAAGAAWQRVWRGRPSMLGALGSTAARAESSAPASTAEPADDGKPASHPARLPWEYAWPAEHRWAALALAGLTALACFAVADTYRRGSTGALASLGAMWVYAALVALESRRHAAPALRAGATVLAALGSFWLARYLGLTNPQWYVALPALALLWEGDTLLRRRRAALSRDEPLAPAASREMVELSRALASLGLALLLLTTTVQTASGEATDGVYVAVLVLESVVAVLIGVGRRQRAYVLAGAAGAALAALRALLLLLSHVPLFVVFGIAALLLLALGALLALLRERLGRAAQDGSSGGRAAISWADWD